MKDFRELKVWEKGHKLVLSVYRVQGVAGEKAMPNSPVSFSLRGARQANWNTTCY